MPLSFLNSYLRSIATLALLLLGCTSPTTNLTPRSTIDRVTLTVYVSGMT